MANVLFRRGDTATINSTAIVDGQLLWNTVTGEIWEDVGTSRISCGKLVDTSLNPTSPNAVSNQAVTGSIINTREEVLAITANYIPCGTKPVKELLKTYVITIDISGWTAETGGYYANATLTGLLATDKPYWSMRSATNYPTTAEEANYKLLKSVTCAADTLTFHATAAPSAALTIEVRL